MNLNFKGKHPKFFKEHYSEIINYFCEGVPAKEISKNLKRDYGANIKYQAINGFYRRNKKVIDDCIEAKKKEDIENFKEILALDFCKDTLKDSIRLIFKTSEDDIKALEPKERLKLGISAINAMAKLEGLDKSEININNTAFEDFFDEDIIQDALDDYHESPDEGSD